MPLISMKYTSNWMLRFCKEMLHYHQNSIHWKADFYRKKLSQDNNTTAMLIWCLKQLKGLILKFSKSIFELVHCNTCFFPFRSMWWWCGRQLNKLLWIQRWCVFPSLSYIGSHTFHESWKTLSNYLNYFQYIYLFKPMLIMWTKIKWYDEKPRFQR